MAKIIGIDLGTTKSVVSVMESGQPTVIANQEGGRTTPSIVALSKSGEWLVGQVAKRQSITNPERTIFSIKRFMGRQYREVGEELKMINYSVVKGDDDNACVVSNDQKQSPPEISAMVLSKLKEAAEAYLDQGVTDAVITVPACFNERQRQATKEAAKIAGFHGTRIFNESTAAAFAYGIHKKTEATIAVYDFGGGSFDVSILKVGDGVTEVMSISGDSHLGGDNIDQRIMDWIVSEFKKGQGIDLSKDKMTVQRLRDIAERVKMELSTILETDAHLSFVTADSSGPKHLLMKLTRSRYEQMCEDIFQRSVGPCKQAMHDAGVTPDKIDDIILVGGSTRIPRIQAIVRELFKKEPNKRMNPDEVVAVGAALQAGVLSGEVKESLCLNVTSLSFGIETLGGIFTRIIGRNSFFPARKSETFSTAVDNQTSVEIKAFQGEYAMANDNLLLRRFTLVGIPPAPRGVPQIEVTFDIDANGILNITAENRGAGPVHPERHSLTS